MDRHPKIRLSRLREIGWRFWDPIGLAVNGATPNEAVADEYDGYLLQAASILTRGGSTQEVTAYLTSIAAEHMGLSNVNAQAAADTTGAIADYIKSLSKGYA